MTSSTISVSFRGLLCVLEAGRHSCSYVIFKRNLLMSELAVWLVAAIPGFWIVSRAGLLVAPDRLMLQFVTEVSFSILSAALADILNAYGLLPALMWGKQAKTVRVPIRRVLLHASFTPLMVGVSIYLIFSGFTGERHILDTAGQMLLNAEQSLRLTVSSWNQNQQVALKHLGIQARRIQEGFLQKEVKNYGFALLLVDLDNFKPINDLYGHAVGDRAMYKAKERGGSCWIEHDGKRTQDDHAGGGL